MTCGHNKSFKERCIECELVLVREGLAWSERKASEYRDAVVRLEAELAPTKPQPNFAKSSLASGALTEPQTLSKPEEKRCLHPRAEVWFYRDDDTYMRCPDCNSRWCEDGHAHSRPKCGGVE
jgi:hypothetical protein